LKVTHNLYHIIFYWWTYSENQVVVVVPLIVAAGVDRCNVLASELIVNDPKVLMKCVGGVGFSSGVAIFYVRFFLADFTSGQSLM